jgi:hypothetical protein
VIDVLRAFTTAAYLFDAGMPEIILAGEIEVTFALRVDCFDFAMVVDDQNKMQPKLS